MPLQSFIDKVGPVVSATWLNAVDLLKFTIFADSTTKAQARTALTTDAPLEVVNGGTGQRSLGALTQDLLSYIFPQTTEEAAANITPTDYSYMPGNVMRYGAVGDGATNDTAAIQDAISVASASPNGELVYLPTGTYAVTEINLSSATSIFSRSLKLKGDGRYLTKIVPFAAGNVLLNMKGQNNAHIEGMTFDSSSYTSQCAIFAARTTTSTNCNNNKFRDIFVDGSYSKASVVLNGSESSNWFNCRFTNSNAAASYCTFWSGGGALIGGLQSITTVSGGTVTNVNNPNTDNKMFGCEFYGPYNNATIVRFSQSCGYKMFGCTVISGAALNCKLVQYGDNDGSNRINCYVTWSSCHFEGFGATSTVHYLKTDGATVFFQGISSIEGSYILDPDVAIIDHDRTTVASQPVMEGSIWTTFTAAPNEVTSRMYVYALYGCDFCFKSSQQDGTMYVSGFVQNSRVDTVYYLGGATRFVGCWHTTVAASVPTTGTYTVGETIQLETPVVGQPIGWKCTVSGTLGTLNGGITNGSIDINTNLLTVSSTTGLAEGQRISIVGVSSGPFYIRKLVGTVAYLDANANATVVGSPMSFANATLVAMANL